jgi:predicted transcriptional regulator
MVDMNATLIKEIMRIVDKKGLTHQDLSRLSGVPQSALAGIIKGRKGHSGWSYPYSQCVR